MVSIAKFRKIALSFPDTTEEPHFEKTSFRVKKKLFATYDETNKRACIKLSEIDQNVFISADRQNIRAVENKWGKQGWTFIEMDKINKDLFFDALTTAYCEAAPKKLKEQVRPNDSDKK